MILTILQIENALVLQIQDETTTKEYAYTDHKLLFEHLKTVIDENNKRNVSL